MFIQVPDHQCVNIWHFIFKNSVHIFLIFRHTYYTFTIFCLLYNLLLYSYLYFPIKFQTDIDSCYSVLCVRQQSLIHVLIYFWPARVQTRLEIPKLRSRMLDYHHYQRIFLLFPENLCSRYQNIDPYQIRIFIRIKFSYYDVCVHKNF